MAEKESKCIKGGRVCFDERELRPTYVQDCFHKRIWLALICLLVRIRQITTLLSYVE